MVCLRVATRCEYALFGMLVMVELFFVVFLVALVVRIVEHRGRQRQARLTSAYFRATQVASRGMRRA